MTEGGDSCLFQLINNSVLDYQIHFHNNNFNGMICFTLFHIRKRYLKLFTGLLNYSNTN